MFCNIYQIFHVMKSRTRIKSNGMPVFKLGKSFPTPCLGKECSFGAKKTIILNAEYYLIELKITISVVLRLNKNVPQVI